MSPFYKMAKYVKFKNLRAFSNVCRAVPREISGAQTDCVYSRVIKTLPEGVEMSFAYGSGVFKQTGHADMQKNMLDFIVVVDRPTEWHSENLKSNGHHYSFLKYFGANTLSVIQELGAGVYFNTLVPFEDRLIKYGVISTNRLLKDLTTWDQLYISGRLHKPVKFITNPISSDVKDALNSNLVSALYTALLVLPEKFSETDLYTKITSLSYTGDVRMTIGEDKNKVNNIVRPNLERFRDLYSDIIKNDEYIQYDLQTGHVEQSLEEAVIKARVYHLPAQLCHNLLQNYDYDDDFAHKKEIDYRQPLMEVLSVKKDLGTQIAKAVAAIVFLSSKRQTSIGVLMGGSKSLTYGLKKITKWFYSTKQE